MHRSAAWLGVCALLLAGTAHAQPAPDCAAHAIAHLNLRDTAGVLTAEVRLDGRPVSMVLDTGSESGLVTPEAAAKLSTDTSLRPPPIALRMYGANGGQTLARVVSISNLQLGTDADAPHVALTTVPVSRLPFQPMIRPPIAGLLGADLLSHFDLELDLPHARATLYAPPDESCGAPPGWTGATRTDLVRLGDRLVAAVKLDSQPISALVDTGARSRVVGLNTALGIGVNEAALGADNGGTNAGFGTHIGIYRWHKFKSFEFAGQRDHDIVLTVTPLDDIADMLLGADWFATRKVWISWSRSALWVAR